MEYADFKPLHTWLYVYYPCKSIISCVFFFFFFFSKSVIKSNYFRNIQWNAVTLCHIHSFCDPLQFCGRTDSYRQQILPSCRVPQVVFWGCCLISSAGSEQVERRICEIVNVTSYSTAFPTFCRTIVHPFSITFCKTFSWYHPS